MEHSFWVERWQEDNIGWHQEKTNSLLEKFWPLLELPAKSTVLVPCCGKSLDMLYFANLTASRTVLTNDQFRFPGSQLIVTED